MRILLIKTSSLGDVVHNLPLVADILSHRPQTVLDWVVEKAFADIPALHPRVARVIPVATRRWRGSLWRPRTWREMAAFRRELQEKTYDLVLDTQGLLKSAVIARLVHGVRCGQDRDSAREPLAARFYDRVYAVPRGQHAVARNRELAALALGYPVPETPPDYGLRPPQDPPPVELPQNCVVCLHGSSRDAKLWPEPNWVELARELARQGLAPLLPWGSAAERARAERLARTVAGARVLPGLGLRQLAALLAQAHAVVGVDTGLIHLAAALGRPVVAIYTGSAPELTGVLPSDPARAVNLGGIGARPSPQEALAALARLGVAA